MKNRQATEDYIDIKELFGKFVSKWYYFAIAFVLLFSLGLLWIQTSPTIYAVNSVMKMNVGTTKAEMILDATRPQDRNNQKNIEDEILVIKSSEYVREALTKLDFSISYFADGILGKKEIYKNQSPVLVELDSSSLQISGLPIQINILSNQEYEISIKGESAYLYDFENAGAESAFLPGVNFTGKYKFNELAKSDFFGFRISLNEAVKLSADQDLSFVVNNPDALVKEYLKKLNIEAADRNSNILLLSLEGTVVEKEREFLNSLMEVVQQRDLDMKNQEGIATINFIDYQLEDVTQSLSKAERDMESFQYSTTSLGDVNTLYAKREQLETELADLKLRLNYFRNVLDNLESVEGVSRISGPSSVGIEDPIFSSLLQKLTDLNQQRVQLGRTATEANPMVQRLDLEIKTTKDALRDKINGGINTNTILLNDVSSRIAQTNDQINRLPSTEIRRLGVQRKLTFSDNTYDLFLERKAAAAIALATNVSDWAIVEWARADDDPVSPNKMFIYLLMLFLAIVIPAGSILAVDYFNNSIKSKTDIEKITNIPVLGTVTKGNKYVKLASEYDARSPLLESLRSVRLNLQFFLPHKTHQVIGITSSTSGEGKTFCSVNLAIIMAQSGKKVLLLDADLRKSNMANYFHVDNSKGLSTYLIGNSDPHAIIHQTKVKNLDLILSGPFPPNPFELLSHSKMDELVGDLKNRYDYIILDTPPLGIVSDYLLFLPYVDASIYVTRYGYTDKKYLDKVNELYDTRKITNLSIILNDVKSTALYGSMYHTFKDNGYHSKHDLAHVKKEIKNEVSGVGNG